MKKRPQISVVRIDKISGKDDKIDRLLLCQHYDIVKCLEW
jgi:hypothetical protein